ncbi:hypothetical protein V6N12_021360 [Hibiscus sabdariffa]|uniref:Clp R domain-containing protein n=1 Tax=Hibiscus sabdariffa TaxID=183260 RepID=A0ABR2FRE7_9ROSI
MAIVRVFSESALVLTTPHRPSKPKSSIKICGLQTTTLRIRSNPISLYNKPIIFGQDFRSPSSRLGSGSGSRCVAIQVAKFKGFTGKAIEAIMFAQEESRRIGDPEIDGHHILFGLISECSIAAKPLKSIGIKFKHVREEAHVLRGRGVDRLGFEFSASAAKDLILSFGEARRLGHNYIGPGHLLIGTLRRPEEYAADVLRVCLGVVDFKNTFILFQMPDLLFAQLSTYLTRLFLWLLKTLRLVLLLLTKLSTPEEYGANLADSFLLDLMQCVGFGATTIDEYREHIRKDPPLTNSDGVLPDKAIDLIDKAGARVSARHAELLEVVRELRREFRLIIKSKKEAERSLDLEMLKELHHREMELRFQIYTFSKMSEANEIVEEVDVRGIVSSWTGIPIEKLYIDDSNLALKMEETLHKRVVGQDEAVKLVCTYVHYGLWCVPGDKPIECFFFFGPAGVGKSELAKALAANFFGSEEAVIQFDMREFMDCHATSKLIGSSPEGGKLTEAVRRRPRTVVLFKEIDKAHRVVLRMICHISHSGKLEDGKGRIVDFRNTVMIMTCNVGSDVIGTGGAYHNEDCSYNIMKGLGKEKLQQLYKGMLMPCLVIAFRQLTKPEVKQIADIKLKGLSDRLKVKEIEIRVTERFRERVVKKGYDFRDGAWSLCITITNLENIIAEKMVTKKINEGDSVLVDVDTDGNVLVFP